MADTNEARLEGGPRASVPGLAQAGWGAGPWRRRLGRLHPSPARRRARRPPARRAATIRFGVGPSVRGGRMPSNSDSNSSPSIVSFSIEQLGQPIEHGTMRGQRLLRTLEGAVDDLAHLGVDLGRDLVAVVALLADLAAQEDHLVLLAEGERPELLAHAVLGDHGARQAGGLLDVVRASRWWCRRRRCCSATLPPSMPAILSSNSVLEWRYRSSSGRLIV